jgi:heme exporter protein D
VNATPGGFQKRHEIMNLGDILGMDKYAGYLMSCVALTAVVLIGNVWLARRALSQAQVKARRRAATNRGES